MTEDGTAAPWQAPLDRYGPLENISAKQAAMIMVRLQRIRHDAVKEFVKTATEAARKKADAVILKARTQLEAKESTVEDRKARAVLESAEAFYLAECADVVVEGAEKSLYLLKDDWDTCRSITANERAEQSAVGGFGS